MTSRILDWAREALGSFAHDLRRQYDNSGLVSGQSLVDAAHSMTEGVCPSEGLENLIQTAHEEMTLAHKYQKPNDDWRRIFTDASVLQSLADILKASGQNSLAESLYLSCIARLDRAIIVAGPCGEGRLDFIIEFISQLQSCMLRTKKRDPGPSSNADSSAPASLCLSSLATTLYGSVRRIDSNSSPSLGAFITTFCNEPFILSGFAQDWPALQEHPWRSLEYLRKVAGPGRIVPVEVGSDYRTDDWTQTLMSWDTFLNSLSRSDTDATSRSVLYLAQHNLFTQFPSLRDDIIIPDYAYAAPAAPESYPDYRPPANEEQLVINAWLGPAGTTSPAHTDPFFNLYAQVVGRKTVWLSPPNTTPYMYSYSDIYGSAVCENVSQSNPAANNVEPSMSNTSRLDVFAPDAKQFPLFAEHVTSSALCATLDPGDVLYFPPGWWHAMRSEETSFSVSMWF